MEAWWFTSPLPAYADRRMRNAVHPTAEDALLSGGEGSRTRVWRVREYEYQTEVASEDATSVLWSFARKCAMTVAHLWEMSTPVSKYLETGTWTGDVHFAAKAAAHTSNQGIAAAASSAAAAAAITSTQGRYCPRAQAGSAMLAAARAAELVDPASELRAELKVLLQKELDDLLDKRW